ncbi:molecular chaperone [Entomohabitans teleogrylli]|uniref:fimbrial biogenesis chaperone n=1 Tax=Entomohabitans teleogrylli TaxID=1384589 RepID=UPI00073D9AB4|nr:molecular chaperone [Entomohabitans teleogrylli]
MKTSRLLLIALFGVLFSFISTMAQAGIAIGGTRVIFAAEKKEKTVSVKNVGNDSAYLIQSWVENIDGSKKTPFTVTPPLFRINSNSENLLRIVYMGAPLPTDRESIYWLSVKSIPGVDSAKITDNSLQVVMKTRVKLIYRPAGLPGNPEDAGKALQPVRDGNMLVMRNPGPWYVSLYSLSVDGKEIKEADLVPPKGEARFKLPGGVGRNVTWQNINDYGAISSKTSKSI